MMARTNKDDLELGWCNAQCVFCNKKAVAFWHLEGCVDVCRHCALTILPALIADAVSTDPRFKAMYEGWQQMNQRYWEALATAKNSQCEQLSNECCKLKLELAAERRGD